MGQLPDPDSIPGMPELLATLDPSLTILGNEPNVSWEMKLLNMDVKITECVREGNLEAFGRLTEFREAIIEERFILTEEYIKKRNAVIAEIEPQEAAALKAGNEPGARRFQFEKFRRIFRAQEQFIARNYPNKFMVKERLKGWTANPSGPKKF
jgi:hypothetical protein